ncbi:MAG: hypothetical protein ACXW3E_06845 [Thermoanaerobaculia bacterium]
MNRPRIGFLPVFFTALSIAFCIALWLRIRSYSDEPVTQQPGQEQGQNLILQRSASSSPGLQTMDETSTQTVVETTSTRRSRRAGSTSTEGWQIVESTPPATTTTAVTPAAPAAAERQSLLSRIVKPIVNAITGGPSKPQPQQASPSSSSRPQSGQNSGSTDTTGTRADPNDPTSDTQPPRLIAIGFTPPQVHDGEETLLAVQASDDLSGIRSISGTIAAPSGAVQGFACQRELDTDRYIARITVPKDAAEGVWHVNYLSLIDNASNAATISSAQGGLPPTASFRVVSSTSDSQGPQLKAIWLDRLAMKAGEKNTLFVDAGDDKSGVNLVSGVFLSPAKHARLGFVCRPGSGTWECELSTPTCIDCGDWQLEQVQLQDKANNMTTVRGNNPMVANVRVNISSDRCDSTPPSLQQIGLDRAVVSNAADSVISVTASASDDMCGIMSMSGQVSGPAGASGSPRLYFSFTPADSQTWIGRITVPRLAAKGMWRITWIQVLDQAHNLKTYSQGDPALVAAAFSVQ